MANVLLLQAMETPVESDMSLSVSSCDSSSC